MAYKRGYIPSSVLRCNNPFKSVNWALRAKDSNFSPAIKYINLLENNNKFINNEFINSYRIIKNKPIKNKNIDIMKKIHASKYNKFFRVGLLKNDLIFNFGLSYLLDKKYLKAFACFYQLSKSNHTDAEADYFISKIYHKAYDSIRKTFFTSEELCSNKFSISNKKHKYLKKAAKNNLAIAKYKLGLEYENKKNFQKAVKYFLSGASQRHPASQFKIAIFYFDGIYLEQDQKKGISYFKKSAKKWFYRSTKKVNHNLLKRPWGK
jgi:TPR repeat protein